MLAAIATDDLKGSFVLAQLPVALQAAVLQAVGLASAFASLPGKLTYVVLVLLTATSLYLVGSVIDQAAQREALRQARSNGKDAA